MNIFQIAKQTKKTKKLYNGLLNKEQRLGTQIEKEKNEDKKQKLIELQSHIRNEIQKLAFSSADTQNKLKNIKESPARNSLPLKKQKLVAQNLIAQPSNHV